MKQLLSLSLALLGLCSCQEQSSVIVQPQTQNSVGIAFREITYFTPTATGRDMELGTHLTTYFKDHRVFQGGVQTYHRTFDSAVGEGVFRRLSFPEIAFRSSQLGLVAQGAQIQKVTGVETFVQDVIDTLRLSSFNRNDFKRPYYLGTLEPDLREWWALTHLLEGKFDLHQKANQFKGKQIGRFKVDSVWVYGIEDDDLGDCLHYTAWYALPDTLVGGMLTVQSMKTSPKLATETKNSKYLGAKAVVKHSIWVDPKNGRLCKEDMLRDYTIQMKDTVAQVLREFPAQVGVMSVYRYED